MTPYKPALSRLIVSGTGPLSLLHLICLVIVMNSWHALPFLQELELLEAELQGALQHGRADPFVTFLYGVILSDRCERDSAPKTFLHWHPGFCQQSHLLLCHMHRCICTAWRCLCDHRQ